MVFFRGVNKLHLKIVTVFLVDRCQDQSGEQRLDRRKHGESADDQSGHTVYGSGVQKVQEDRDEKYGAYQNQDQSQNGEKLQWFIVLE